MSDIIIRQAARSGDWDPNLAIRYGLMTEGPMQKPLSLKQATCAEKSCNAPLVWSDCSHCNRHLAIGNPLPGGIEKPVGYTGTFSNGASIQRIVSNDECECCHGQ